MNPGDKMPQGGCNKEEKVGKIAPQLALLPLVLLLVQGTQEVEEKVGVILPNLFVLQTLAHDALSPRTFQPSASAFQ